MSNLIRKTLAIEILSALFILIFAYTAFSKLLDYSRFKALLAQSPLIGDKAGLVAWLLPLLELVAVLFLFFPQLRGYGFRITFTLMSAFTLYVSYMILFIPELPCACGGVISSMSWQQHLLFNIVLTILSAIGIRAARKDDLVIAIHRTSRTPV